jgi:hypothetical protein
MGCSADFLVQSKLCYPSHGTGKGVVMFLSIVRGRKLRFIEMCGDPWFDKEYVHIFMEVMFF